MVDELQAKDGVPPERIVIGGFSMGATTAAESFLRYNKRLGGLVMLNGWLLPGARSALQTYPIDNLPILVSHGSEDEQVGFDCGRRAVELLGEAGASVQFEVQDGQTHVQSGFGQGKEHALQFLAAVLGSTT